MRPTRKPNSKFATQNMCKLKAEPEIVDTAYYNLRNIRLQEESYTKCTKIMFCCRVKQICYKKGCGKMNINTKIMKNTVKKESLCSVQQKRITVLNSTQENKNTKCVHNEITTKVSSSIQPQIPSTEFRASICIFAARDSFA